MASRDIVVKLRADVGSYRKAMQDASKSTDALARSGQALQNAGGKISSVGDSLTKSVTAPMALAGGAALKLAGDFDSAFTSMVGLAGVSASEVDGLKESVLSLAEETGRAPQELAEGLMQIRSAGLSGQAALDVLDASAKAAAAGMGDTATIANALTNVLNGYGPANITAADAMDVLTASVREGKAEAADMAPQFGRLVPLAAELGVSFGDVGGSLAFLTKSTGDAAQSSTALQGILSKLLRPSQQGARALEEIGIKGDGVRRMLGEKGLDGTLVTLRERLGDSGFQLLFDDVQALNGALQITGPQAEDARKVIDRVGDSAGAAADAYDNWAKSIGAQNSRAWATFLSAMVRIGDEVAPMAADVAAAVASIAAAFSGLPDGAQKAVVFGAAVVAAVGPVLSIGGRLVSTWGLAMKVFAGMQNWAVPAKAVESAFSGVGTAATGAGSAVANAGVMAGLAAPLVLTLGVAWAEAARTKAEARRRTDELVAAMQEEADGARDATDEAVRLGLAHSDVGTALREAGGDMDVIVDGLRNEGDAIEALDDRLDAILRGHTSVGDAFDQAGVKSSDFTRELERLIEKSDLSGGQIADLVEGLDGEADRLGEAAVKADDLAYSQDGMAGSTGDANAVLGEQQQELEDAKTALQGYADALRAQVDPIFAAMDAMTGIRDAQVGYQDALVGVQEAQAAVDEAIASHGATSAEAADAQRNLEEAQRAVTDAQWAQVTSASEADAALAGLLDAVSRGDVSVEAFRATLDQWVAQGFLPAAEAADIAAWSVGGLIGQAQEADRQRVDIPVGQHGAEGTKTLLDRANEAALRLAGQRPNVHASASGADDAQNRLRSVRDAAFSIPSSRNIDITATITSLARGIFPSLRAEGGPVRAGEAYIVGERRPELFIPDQDGTIFPSVPPMGALYGGGGYGGGGGGGPVYQFTGDITIVNPDPEAVVASLVRWTRNNGPVPVKVRA